MEGAPTVVKENSVGRQEVEISDRSDLVLDKQALPIHGSNSDFILQRPRF
jgi:hypothetical protein